MTEEVQENTNQNVSDKELNFRRLESKYEQQLEQERLARVELEQKLAKLSQSNTQEDEDDDEDVYIDKKKFKKTLNKFEEHTTKKAEAQTQTMIQRALQEERKRAWLERNADFADVMQNYANKLPEIAPELAETILSMPEGFERQKLVYNNIKALKLDKPAPQEPSIQDKINQNRRSPYYQPSGIGNTPYVTQGDYSEAGKKQAYEKLQQLKNNMRLG